MQDAAWMQLTEGVWRGHKQGHKTKEVRENKGGVVGKKGRVDKAKKTAKKGICISGRNDNRILECCLATLAQKTDRFLPLLCVLLERKKVRKAAQWATVLQEVVLKELL